MGRPPCTLIGGDAPGRPPVHEPRAAPRRSRGRRALRRVGPRRGGLPVPHGGRAPRRSQRTAVGTAIHDGRPPPAAAHTPTCRRPYYARVRTEPSSRGSSSRSRHAPQFADALAATVRDRDAGRTSPPAARGRHLARVRTDRWRGRGLRGHALRFCCRRPFTLGRARCIAIAFLRFLARLPRCVTRRRRDSRLEPCAIARVERLA